MNPVGVGGGGERKQEIGLHHRFATCKSDTAARRIVEDGVAADFRHHLPG